MGRTSEKPRGAIQCSQSTAGRVLVTGSSIIRYPQDLERGYGLGVRAFEIPRLSETDYEERALAGGQPIVAPTGRGWNGVGMHPVDAHEIAGGHWLAVVDGRGKERMFGPRRPLGSNTKRNRADKDRPTRSAPPISNA